MKIVSDPKKRAETLKDRSLDFEDAKEVFAGKTLDFPDDRHDYGELRIITVGKLRGRMVILAWTPRDGMRRVFSMRKANDREKKRFGQRLEES